MVFFPTFMYSLAMVKLTKKGFTLIELLIVIVIIAILITLLAVSYTTIQRNSRDTQRKSDLTVATGVLERFYSDNSHYPSSTSGEITYDTSNCAAAGTAVAWGTGAIECGGVNYIKQLPKDPIGISEYCYLSLSSNQKYELYAQIEGKGNIGAITPAGCSGTDYNYRVTSND